MKCIVITLENRIFRFVQMPDTILMALIPYLKWYLQHLVVEHCKNTCFIILLKKPSTILSHDLCFGVNMNSNRLLAFERYYFVSSEVWTMSLLRNNLILLYLSPRIFRNSMLFLLLWFSITKGMASKGILNDIYYKINNKIKIINN